MPGVVTLSSRVGRVPVVLPKGVTCDIKGCDITVSGSKGKLSFTMPAGVQVEVKDGKVLSTVDMGVRLKPRELLARHGLVRARLRDMVAGVTNGFERKIELQGAGYRPTVGGTKLTLTLGFSHPVVIELPAGVKAVAERIESGGREMERHIVTLSGIDKIAVGEIAARIRRIRKADAYKGKGIRYVGEYVRKKAGKTSVAGAGTGGK